MKIGRHRISIPAIQNAVLLVLCVVTIASLLWIGATVQIETYDGLEYLSSALHILGEPGTIFPKNALQISVLTLLISPFVKTGGEVPLTFLHLIYTSISLALAGLTALYCRRTRSALPIFVLVCLAVWNRVFLRYSPFLLPDALCGLLIVTWFYYEHRWARPVLLAAIALCRPHAVLIPLIALLWQSRDPKQRKKALWTIAVSAPVFTLFFVFFYMAAWHTSPLDAARRGFNFVLFYAGDAGVRVAAGQPFYVYFAYLLLSWKLPGLILTVAGLFRVRKLNASAQSLLLGSAAFLVVLMMLGQKEGRYLLPLLPAWVVLQAAGLELISKQKNWIGFVLLLIHFLFQSDELLRFRDPIYQRNFGREAAQKISAWSESPEITFIPYYAAFHPRAHQFHWNDKFFYFYHWWTGAMNVYGRKPTRIYTAATFKRYGDPIPDQLQQIAPAGHTVVVPATESIDDRNAKDFLLPIHAMRWFPRENAKGRSCDPKVKEFCLELLVAFPGYKWN